MRMYKGIGIAKDENGGIIYLCKGKGIDVVENESISKEIYNRETRGRLFRLLTPKKLIIP